jgi:hypothetical protein
MTNKAFQDYDPDDLSHCHGTAAVASMSAE